MAKFKKGDKVVRCASRQADCSWSRVENPTGLKVVKECCPEFIELEGVCDSWEPKFFELYVEPQPEPVKVTEPSVQQIPGVPDGYQAVRYGRASKDEYCLNADGEVLPWQCDAPSARNYLIVEPIVPPAPPTPLPTTVKVQLNRYLVGDLARPSSLRVMECTQENIDSCFFGYRLLGPSETLELEVEV